MRKNPPKSLPHVLLLCSAVVASTLLGGVVAVAEPEQPDMSPIYFSAAQLDELVAPVALYPDVVLDSLLPATVSPSNVADAARYVASQGGSVQRAPEDAGWDVGLVALLQYPEVLQWMGEDPLWVERMGYAVAVQQGEVLAAIQRYRARAQAAGVLTSNDRFLVQSGAQIQIYTASPQVVYVPVYDPWALDSWSPGRSFYHSWLSFSFGSQGYWGRYRIHWGLGIYDYGNAWWGGRWSSRATHWRTGQPTRWFAASRHDQPWQQQSWRPSGWGRHSTALRMGSRTPTARRVNVALPTVRSQSDTRAGVRGGSSRVGVRSSTRRQPTSPAAPITRWNGTRTQTPPPAVGPAGRAQPGRTQHTPALPPRRSTPALGRTIPTRLVEPALEINGRAPVRQWSRRGNGSLLRDMRQGLGTSPPRLQTPRGTLPAARVVPPQSRPRIRSFPPSRANTAVPDGARARLHRGRGARALSDR